MADDLLDQPPPGASLEGDAVDPTQVDDVSQETPPPDEDSIDIADVNTLDVKLNLSPEDKAEIVSYLDTNLPNMRPTIDDEKRIKSWLAMYEMSVRKRNFPYEDAPSLASSDAHDIINKWLDKTETAFLRNQVTFAIDRDETSKPEESVRRMESTYHKKFFWKSGFADDLRLIIFEAGLLGTSIVSVRENYNIRPVRKKVFIRDDKDLIREKKNITQAEYNAAQKKISKGEYFITDRDSLEIVNIGPKANRVDQTKFWYPRNVKLQKDWQIMSEQELYTKSDFLSMVEKGELDRDEVDNAISKRKEAVRNKIAYDGGGSNRKVLEDVKPHVLDVNWSSEIGSIKKMGEGYDDQFYVYRVTMLYKVKTGADPTGNLRSWIEVIYCPAGGNILSASFCQDGSPYYLIRYRPVPYKSMGVGIAQERFAANCLDSDMKSYFLASLEQELGSPTLIRKASSLWASGFRKYPGAVAAVDDINADVKDFPFQEKSRLSVEGMKIILSSSPGVNAGMGYASGKREELVQGSQDVSDQARMHSIAMDIDNIANASWKILCRLSKMNTDEQKIIDWIYKDVPPNMRMYMLEDEMDPKIFWTSVMSAVTMNPDARFQQAMMDYQIFHQQVPVSVNNPELTIAWLDFLANFRPEMTPENRKNLLPQQQHFEAMQQQQAMQGAQNGQPAVGPPPPQGQKPQVPPLVAQSPATPFRGPPPRRGGGPPQAPMASALPQPAQLPSPQQIQLMRGMGGVR